MNKIFTYIIFIILLASCTSTGKLSRDSGSMGSFNDEYARLIMSADTSVPMRVFKTDNLQDSILLRQKSEDVTVNPGDPVFQAFIRRLYATVRDSASLGVGISAPQVGILKNIIWVQRFDKDNKPFEVYLNPRIVQYSEMKQDCREGCLSVPEIRDTTRTRAYAILIEYDKPDKTHQLEMVEAFTAVIFQHEIDHLNGILFTDHLKKHTQP